MYPDPFLRFLFTRFQPGLEFFDLFLLQLNDTRQDRDDVHRAKPGAIRVGDKLRNILGDKADILFLLFLSVIEGDRLELRQRGQCLFRRQFGDVLFALTRGTVSPDATGRDVGVIPEPSTAILMGLGLAGLAGVRRKSTSDG